MKFINNFSNFLVEQTTGDENQDRQMDISQKNTTKQYSQILDEFNKNKDLISAIFSDKSLDDKARRLKLKPFLKDGDVEKMIFDNDLLKLWCDVCNLNRKITDLDSKIETGNTEVQKSVGDKQMSDIESKNIELQKDMIKNLEIERKNLEDQILKKEKDKDMKLKQYQADLKKMKQETKLNK